MFAVVHGVPPDGWTWLGGGDGGGGWSRSAGASDCVGPDRVLIYPSSDTVCVRSHPVIMVGCGRTHDGVRRSAAHKGR